MTPNEILMLQALKRIVSTHPYEIGANPALDLDDESAIRHAMEVIAIVEVSKDHTTD